MERHRLFIYGTLKRQRSQHHRLRSQVFVGEAETLPHFRLLSLGWYPGLAPSADNGQAIQGEIWDVSPDCLQALDAFEGEEYARQTIEIVRNGQVESVQAYVLIDPDWSRPDAGITWTKLGL